jgi:hypothetical protein
VLRYEKGKKNTQMMNTLIYLSESRSLCV